MKDDAVYLRHVKEFIRRIEEDVAGGGMPSWPPTRFRTRC